MRKMREMKEFSFVIMAEMDVDEEEVLKGVKKYLAEKSKELGRRIFVRKFYPTPPREVGAICA